MSQPASTPNNDDPLKRLRWLLQTQFIRGSGLTDLEAVIVQAGIHEIERLRPDGDRFQWLQAQLDANTRWSVYEYGTKVFELRTAIDLCRGMEVPCASNVFTRDQTP